MGMYTEVFARMVLVKEAPRDVLDALRSMMGGELAPDAAPSRDELPAHPLFDCPRWDLLGCGTSAYFPGMADSHLRGPSTHDGSYDVLIHGNLKDYSGEIEKFFDWIDPYIDASPGEFIGYELYEDVDPGTAPHIYFKKEA